MLCSKQVTILSLFHGLYLLYDLMEGSYVVVGSHALWTHVFQCSQSHRKWMLILTCSVDPRVSVLSVTSEVVVIFSFESFIRAIIISFACPLLFLPTTSEGLPRPHRASPVHACGGDEVRGHTMQPPSHAGIQSTSKPQTINPRL